MCSAHNSPSSTNGLLASARERKSASSLQGTGTQKLESDGKVEDCRKRTGETFPQRNALFFIGSFLSFCVVNMRLGNVNSVTVRVEV